MTTSLYTGSTPVIINHLGVVHRVKRDGSSCPAVVSTHPDHRRPVTANQCMVYRLASCRSCWHLQLDFDKFTGRVSV